MTQAALPATFPNRKEIPHNLPSTSPLPKDPASKKYRNGLRRSALLHSTSSANDPTAEHNLPPNTTTAPAPPSSRRPDLTSFYASLANVSVPASAPAAVAPIPAHVAAAAALYGDALRMLLAGRDHDHDDEHAHVDGEGQQEEEEGEDGGAELLREMLARVAHLAEEPPRRIEGVSDAFLEGLERVGRGRLRAEHKCPICGERFLDGGSLPFNPKSGWWMMTDGCGRQVPAGGVLAVRRPALVRLRMHQAVAEAEPDVSAG
jgi:hypothetical protein